MNLPDELQLDAVRQTAARLAPYIITTPSHHWRGPKLAAALGHDLGLYVKLEQLQRTGTFKPRGAINNVLNLSAEQLRRGITAMSAGNHAIAAAYAAQQLGTHAKIFMPKAARPNRVAMARQLGAEILQFDTQMEMFAACEQCSEKEGRALIPPFDGPETLQGTATAGLEFTEQVPELDAMVLPIGGGGLSGGFAAAVRQVWPKVSVYGVEPRGANVMSVSREAGSPQVLDEIATIADSLAPPMTKPYAFSICEQTIDEIVLVDDQQLRSAMRLLFDEMKVAVEPAGAATTAAVLGPLRERLAEQRVGIILCGANIVLEDFCSLCSDQF